jgi:hypothetical protein
MFMTASRRFQIFLILGVATRFVGMPHVSAQNLILNGGFENPTVAPNTFGDFDPLPWYRVGSINGDIGGVIRGNGGFSDWPLPHEGSQQYVMGSDGQGLFQQFTVESPGLYHVQWWVTPELSTPPDFGLLPYAVRVSDSGGAVTGGGQFDAFDDYQSLKWEFDLSLSSGEYKLQFEGTGTVAPGIFLDDVSITAVPEPTATALVLVGGTAFFLFRSRQREN